MPARGQVAQPGWRVRRPQHQPPGLRTGPRQQGPHHAIAQETSTQRISSMNPLPHRGKLLIATVALACGSLAASAPPPR